MTKVYASEKDLSVLFDGKPIGGIKSISYDDSVDAVRYVAEGDADLRERITRRLLTPRGDLSVEIGNVAISALSMKRAKEDFAKHLERLGGVVRLPGRVGEMKIDFTLGVVGYEGIRRLFANDEELFHYRAARAVREVKKLARRRRMARKKRRGFA